MPATKRAVDMTDVKEKGNFRPRHIKAGDYRATIKDVNDHVKQGEKVSTQWVFSIELEGVPRATYPYYVSHTEKNQAWKVHKLLTACGLPNPKKRVGLDPNKFIGKTLGVAMEDDEYEGKMKSVIIDTFPEDDLEGVAASVEDEPDDADEYEDDEDEEEAPPPRKRAATKKAPAKKATRRKAPEPDEDEEDDIEDVDLEEI